MRREKKSRFVTIGIFVLIGIIVAISLTSNPSHVTDEEVVKCIAEKATLYVQLGCHFCEKQEEMFGENVKYLKIVDCFYGGEGCDEITATPTWVIGNQKIQGMQSIDTLRKLVKC
jgi:hypothetical protein